MKTRSVIIAANPYVIYEACNSNELGDVEVHKRYADEVGGVFWDVIPGNIAAKWKYPDIDTGYFYIAVDQVIRYRFDIERIGNIREFRGEIERFVPPCRRTYWHDRQCEHYFAFLIKKIYPLVQIRELSDFVLHGSQKSVARVQNYAIVMHEDYT